MTDLKNRFTMNKTYQNTNLNNRNNSSGRNPINNNPLAQIFQSNISKQSISMKNITKQKKGGLQKYKKQPNKGAAPKGQFKKYMVQANNVFYEDRDELKQLQKIKFTKWTLFFVWIILAILYFLIGSITPFAGKCPHRAVCGVFVHCPDLFEYDPKQNQCILSEDLIREVSLLAKNQVYKLHRDYGTAECKGDSTAPKLVIDSLFQKLGDLNKAEHYADAAQKFFFNRENQEQYGFQTSRLGVVSPTRKTYSLGCNIQFILNDSNLFVKILAAFLFGIGAIFLIFRLSQSRKYYKMYMFLHNLVMEAPDKNLNVTHTLPDLETMFGKINQDTWARINEIRANQKKIGYYEDDFLYWKAT